MGRCVVKYYSVGDVSSILFKDGMKESSITLQNAMVDSCIGKLQTASRSMLMENKYSFSGSEDLNVYISCGDKNIRAHVGVSTVEKGNIFFVNRAIEYHRDNTDFGRVVNTMLGSLNDILGRRVVSLSITESENVSGGICGSDPVSVNVEITAIPCKGVGEVTNYVEPIYLSVVDGNLGSGESAVGGRYILPDVLRLAHNAIMVGVCGLLKSKLSVNHPEIYDLESTDMGTCLVFSQSNIDDIVNVVLKTTKGTEHIGFTSSTYYVMVKSFSYVLKEYFGDSRYGVGRNILTWSLFYNPLKGFYYTVALGEKSSWGWRDEL